MMKAALSLADLGYRVFPCRPGDKTPLTHHGCLDASGDEDQIIAWWEEHPTANIGVSTDGLLVVDVDPLPSGEFNEFGNDLDQMADLLVSAGTMTPRGGSHFWFRQPVGADLRNTASTIAPGVDTRATGGYVLAPPSVITNVGSYRWMPGFPLETKPSGLAEPPTWILEGLRTDPKTLTAPLGGTEPIPDGMRNATLASIGGDMRRKGFSQRAIEAALRVTNLERCNPALNDAEVAKIAWSVSRYEPDQIATAVAEGWADADIPKDDAKDPGDLPRELLNPGGFLGDVIAWNCQTARKPQPELALAAALALLSALTGRKIQDDTGLRTNLYCLGLCETGGGKDHARKVNKSILQSAGLEKFIGPEGIGSSTGLLSSLNAQPVLLFQIDEFGRFLATLNNPGKSPYLYNVVSVLLKLFTSADTLFIGDAVADMKKVPKIDQPHAVLYTTSVPINFFESLSKESLQDGFVSRLLVFDCADNDPDPRDTLKESCPRDISEQARWWGDYNPGGNLTVVNPTPRTLETSPEARAVFRELEITSRANARGDGEANKTWTRTVEKARKLAILYQVSQKRDSKEISRQAAEWGCWLSHHLTARVQYLAGDWVAENSYEAAHKRIRRIIKAAGTEGVTMSHLSRTTQWILPNQRTEILKSLELSGFVICEKQATGGRPRMVYKTATVSRPHIGQ